MLLSQVLNPKNNNFDLFRLIAALLVIYGHASGLVLVPNVVNSDFVASMLRFEYSGSLAVKFFFLLSGLLVTASFLSRPQIGEFVIKRAARILPGLFVCLCISVFIIGPWFTSQSLLQYFSNDQTWKYLINNTFLFQLEWRLPGVFADSKYGLNGSLWTLPLEVICYLFLAAIYGLGIWRVQWLSNLVLLSVIFLSFFMPQLMVPLFANNQESHLLPGCFALGALFATNQNYIVINKQGALALVLLTALLWGSGLKIAVFYVSFFYCCLYLGSRKIVVEKLKISADPSYGVYIYGFVIQQCIAHVFPAQGVLFNQVFSALIAILIGLLSWFWIERPSMYFVKKMLGAGHLLEIKEGYEIGQKNIVSLVSAKKPVMILGLLGLAWIMHFIALYFIFPGHYHPLSFHHSDFYIPAAFAYALSDAYSYINLLNWPRPLFMWFYKFTGYFGHAGSVAWVVGIVFSNCVLTALLFKRALVLKNDLTFYAFFALYCFVLFTQPYFYTFYSQDIGSQLSYLLLLSGIFIFYLCYEGSLIGAALALFSCSACAFLIKETYILSISFIVFCWFVFNLRKDLIKALAPGVAVFIAAVIAAVVNLRTKSVFVNVDAGLGSDYHISLDILSILKELSRYGREGITPILVIALGLIAFFMYKQYKNKILMAGFFMCVVFAILAWLPNALLPFHHYQGYSFNGLYVCFATLFFVVKMAQEQKLSKPVFWVIIMVLLISPASSIKKYKDDRNQWVLAMERIQTNMLTGFRQATEQLLEQDHPVTVLITGISSPFHPFIFPESIRSFAGVGKVSTYYFVVPQEFPNNLGKKIDLVQYISESEQNTVAADQEWQFDKDGKLVAVLKK
jgi:peptidoglycan/LPS O-acetylase OafA/YrhL